MKEPGISCPKIDLLITHMDNEIECLRDVICDSRLPDELKDKLIEITKNMEGLYLGERSMIENIRNENYNVRKYANIILEKHKKEKVLNSQ